VAGRTTLAVGRRVPAAQNLHRSLIFLPGMVD